MTDIESPDTLATQIVDHVDFCADSPLNPSREIAALIRARDLAIRADERAKALPGAADLTEEQLVELASAAHAAYYASTEHKGVRVGSIPFDQLPPMWQRAWVAAASAVANKLTAERKKARRG